jgi:nicotinamidase-related amidase
MRVHLSGITMGSRNVTVSEGNDRASGAEALLIVDMISTWEFPDAEQLLPLALSTAARIAAFKSRCRKTGVPVIYANDNRGRWRSDFRQVFDLSMARGGDAARISQQLAPDADDYFVLKPKHSAFFMTPLDLLLGHLKARRIYVTGVTGDQCVLWTATDARMRDYEAVVPKDCIASQSKARNKRAVEYFEDVLEISTTPSNRIRLRAR